MAPGCSSRRIEKLEAQNEAAVAPMKVRRLIDPSPDELHAIGEDELGDRANDGRSSAQKACLAAVTASACWRRDSQD